jgi:MFS family permease
VKTLDSVLARTTGLPTGAGPGAARLVALAALGVFFAADDQTSVVAVLPRMIEGVGLTQDQFFRAAWIVNAYILGYVVAMPLMGRIADAFGHARVFAASLGIFILGSAWVAVSNDLTSLSAARAVQAVGGGAVVPVAMAIVADAMPADRRVVGIGAMAAASEAGGLVGPLWGGSIAELLGWRGVFWINIPMCLPIALAMWRGAPLAKPGVRGGIDFIGAGLLGASLAFLTIALTNDPIEPRAGQTTALLYAGAAVSFALFIASQTGALRFITGAGTRRFEPLVDLALFRRRPIAAGMITNCLVGGALIVAMVTVPLFTNVVLGGSAIDGGLNLMRLTIALPIGAFLGGRVASRWGFNVTALLALALAGAGFLGMSRWDESPGFFAFTAPLVVAGLGLGLIIAPVNGAVLNEVEEGQRATVSALLTVTRLIGALVGVALLTTRGLGGFYAEAGLIPLDDPRYGEVLLGLEVEAFRDTFLATALVCFGAAIPAWFLGGQKIAFRSLGSALARRL